VATPLRRIVDSSPLILLAKIGQLDLLRAGVPEIVIPDAVLSEVAAPGQPTRSFSRFRAWRG
jgi:predicted nucleic acid-binding protein